MSKLQSWHKLASLPFFFNESISEPLFINNHEFVVCSSKGGGDTNSGIDKYNIKQNRWERILNYPEQFGCYADTAAQIHKIIHYMYQEHMGGLGY